MCSGLLLAQHSKSQVFHWLLISWPFTFIWHNPEVLIFQGHFVPTDKLTEHKLSCYFLQANVKAFLVFISGMGQPLIILTSGKILSTSTLGIWYLWLKNFSFCNYLKHRTKLLRYHIFLITYGDIGRSPCSQLWCHMFSTFLSHGDFSLLVLNLAMLPNILCFILESICVYAALFVSYLIYFLWNLKLSLHDTLIGIELEIWNRERICIYHI